MQYLDFYPKKQSQWYRYYWYLDGYAHHSECLSPEPEIERLVQFARQEMKVIVPLCKHEVVRPNISTPLVCFVPTRRFAFESRHWFWLTLASALSRRPAVTSAARGSSSSQAAAAVSLITHRSFLFRLISRQNSRDLTIISSMYLDGTHVLTSIFIICYFFSFWLSDISDICYWCHLFLPWSY